MRSVRRGLFLALTAAVLLAAACGGTAAAGIPRQRAVALAQTRAQQLSRTPVTLVSAASGTLRSFEPHSLPAKADEEVWAVTFDGTFPPVSCGPAAPPHPCPSPNASMTVLLDRGTGAFVMGTTGGPGGG
jgi:hypothetical protein